MRNDAAGALRLDDDLLDRPYERKFERSSRTYGSHRRADAPAGRVTGAQPGRRTVEIRGQVQAPRRRSQTQAAIVARPDKTALWAFLLAMFLVLMAVATAHAATF